MPQLLKTRILGILVGLLFLVTGGIFGYFGIIDVYTLFTNSDVIIFSRLSILAAMSPLIFFSMLPLSGYLICTGKQAPDAIQEKFGLLVVIFLITIFLSMVVFSNVYTSNLERKGYIECRGVPIGYMPFMAVKYVVFESMCKKDSSTIISKSGDILEIR